MPSSGSLSLRRLQPADVPQRALALLAASVGPLRRVMAAVAARLVDSRAHDRLLFARLSDYAREQPGVSVRQLQELARVHRALAGLPALEWALVSNALPWSKVRLMVRVAVADDEAEWIARARGLPTRELERQVCAHVRASGTGVPDDEDEPRRCVSLRVPPALMEKWLSVRELAERVAGARLSAGDVLELVVAEAFSAFGVAGAAGAAPDDRRALAPDAWDGSRAGPRAPGREIPDEVLALARGLEQANAHELDRRLRRALRLEQTLDAAMGPLLRVVTCAEYAWEGGYRPLSAYARDELGMSARKARALLRLERVGEVCPALREAYRDGRLSWVKAQCLLPLLVIDLPGDWPGDDWRRAWVAWAERVTVRRLAADVERALLLRAGTTFAWARCESHPERVQDPIPPEEAERERQVCARPVDLEATETLGFRVPVDVAVLFVGVCQAVRARLRVETARAPFESEVFEALLDHALAVWSQRAPGSPRPDPVIERDGYRCVVPGCTSRRNLHDHHVVFRSAGGSDALENRVTLCAYHHQRGVHAGRMRVRGRAPDGLEFELPTGRYASGDVRLSSP